MFVRNKRSVRRGDSYEYLQIVRSYREGGKVRQQVIATLGRRDQLVASGELDGLLRSLAKFSDNLRVVEAVRTSGLAARTARQWGPALVFGRLWERQGLPDLLRKLAQDRKFEFDLERTAFAMALQRLCAPGSDLAGSEWVKTVEAPGFEDLALQHFYRTAAFLAEVRQDLESQALSPGSEPVQPDPGRGLHRHHQPVLLPGHGDRVAQAGLLPGPSARPAPVGVVRGGERHRLAHRLGDFSRQHR